MSFISFQMPEHFCWVDLSSILNWCTFSIDIGLIQHSDMAGLEVWAKLIYYADDSRLCPSLSTNTYRLMSWLLVSDVLIFWCPDVNHQPRTRLGDMLGKLINHSAITYCLMSWSLGFWLSDALIFWHIGFINFSREKVGDTKKTWRWQWYTLSGVMLTLAGNGGPMGCHCWKPTPPSKYHYHTPPNIVRVQISF